MLQIDFDLDGPSEENMVKEITDPCLLLLLSLACLEFILSQRISVLIQIFLIQHSKRHRSLIDLSHKLFQANTRFSSLYSLGGDSVTFVRLASLGLLSLY